MGRANFNYGYNAFQAGVGVPLNLGGKGEYGKLILAATIATPCSSPADNVYLSPVGEPLLSRTFTAKTTYGTIEGLAAVPISATWSALAGFRWMSWQTNYSGPYNQIGFSNHADRADVTVNGYIPLFGLTGKTGGVTVGAVGVPTLLGDVDHKEEVSQVNFIEAKGTIRNGYFAEVFADYTLPSYDLAGLATTFSVFFKASWLDGTGTVDFKDHSQSYIPSQAFELSLHRTLCFVGARATINFSVSDFGLGRLL